MGKGRVSIDYSGPVGGRGEGADHVATTADRSPPDMLRRLVIVAAVALAWYWAGGHPGITHDGRLYAFEALAALHPDVYGGDLFVAYGSQGDYSIFLHLYKEAIRLWGLERGTAVLAVAAQVVWFLSAVLLARRLPPRLSWLFLGLCAVLPRYYGMDFVLSYRETFVTARPWAEAAVLAATAMALGRRPWLAAPLLLTAMALHPLVGITGIALGFVLWFRWTVAWIAVAAGALIAVAGLAWAGVRPFDGLLRQYDPAWLEIVRLRNAIVFLGEWPLVGFNRAILSGVILWLAARLTDDAASRKLLAGCIVIGAGGLAVSYLGADVLHNRLITQLQPWRTLWLGQAMVALGVAVLLTAPAVKARMAMLLALLGAGLAMETAGGLMAIGVLAAFLRFGTAWPKWLAKAAYAAPAVGLALNVTSLYPDLAHLAAGASAVVQARDPAAGVVARALPWASLSAVLILKSWVNALIVGACLVSGYRMWAAERRGLRLGLASAAAVALAASATFGFGLGVAAAPGSVAGNSSASHPFADVVPPGAVVFWEENAASVWFLLGRRSYLGAEQGAGLPFERQTAMEYARRARHLQRFGLRDGDMRWFAVRRSTPVGPLAPGIVGGLCEDPILDVVVLGQPADAPALASMRDGRGVTWYLYSCAPLR